MEGLVEKIQSLETKLKIERQTASSKEVINNSLRQKIQFMEEKIQMNEKEKKALAASEEREKYTKKELHRKQELINSWKEKLKSYKTEVEQLQISIKDSIDRKTYTKAIGEISTLNCELSKMQSELKRMQNRDRQYGNVLEQILVNASPNVPEFQLNTQGLDATQLKNLADQYAKEVDIVYSRFWELI
jgi:chromosome segregation ATPase